MQLFCGKKLVQLSESPNLVVISRPANRLPLIADTISILLLGLMSLVAVEALVGFVDPQHPAPNSAKILAVAFLLYAMVIGILAFRKLFRQLCTTRICADGDVLAITRTAFFLKRFEEFDVERITEVNFTTDQLAKVCDVYILADKQLILVEDSLSKVDAERLVRALNKYAFGNHRARIKN